MRVMISKSSSIVPSPPGRKMYAVRSLSDALTPASTSATCTETICHHHQTKLRHSIPAGMHLLSTDTPLHSQACPGSLCCPCRMNQGTDLSGGQESAEDGCICGKVGCRAHSGASFPADADAAHWLVSIHCPCGKCCPLKPAMPSPDNSQGRTV